MKSFFLILVPTCLTALSYEINFIGLTDEKALKSIFDVSDLVLLQERPPASINGLRYRIASDVPAMLKVLRAYGYYDAIINSEIEKEENALQVSIVIQPGPQYTIGSYEIFKGDCTEPATIPYCDSLSLDLEIGAPALSVDIVNAELDLLSELADCGYPLAKVEKRRVIVDMATKQVETAACIDEGPLSEFGPLTIFGLKNVKNRFITDRLHWEEGEIYNTTDVQETQKKLLNSNLFSSVMISHANELDSSGQLPMKMSLTEAKHQQISIGAFYATVDGPGAIFSWTHRNLRGLGESLSLDGEVSFRYIAGKIAYKKPDFWIMDQTYRVVALIEREDIRAYIAFTYGLGNYIDRPFNEYSNGSFGLEINHYNVADSASNGTYLLMGAPFLVKYSTVEDILNPTKGFTIVYQGAPYQSLEHGGQHFYKQLLTTNFYVPVMTENFIFATRIQLGSIAGAAQQNVPLPLLFLGGSEDDLRGYRYKTVSPLNNNRQPYGGRSALYLTFETRFRFREKIGIVPFADFGTVTFNQWPTVDTKWFKSLGIGLRYFTFFGPLRVDVGFPLDRRRGIDPYFRIYASIGQAF